MARYTEYFTSETHHALALARTSPDGLSIAEAARRLTATGPNLVQYRAPDWKQILNRQFRSFFIYLLLAAVGINFFAADYLDGGLIFLFLLVYVFGGFYQEFRAERAIFSLRTFLKRFARVKRGGAIHRLNIQDLVPGDILFLKPGDLVPADIRFIKTRNLTLDESALTGESEPVHKNSLPIAATTISDDLDSPNLAFLGSTVTSGWAQAVVLSTGENTYFADMFDKLNAIERPSLFEKNIRDIAKFLSKLILLLAVIVLVVKTLIAGTFDSGFLVFLVALIVAVIPEALPLVAAFAFSKGSLILAKKNVIIKRLTALEDLGSVDVLCTDKTGTITQNNLTWIHHHSPAEKTFFRLALISALGEQHHGEVYNPFNHAITEYIKKTGSPDLTSVRYHEVLPFNSLHRTGALAFEENGKTYLLVRGAPEAILASCTSLISESEAHSPLTADATRDILAWFHARGVLGERVLALAYKEVAPESDLRKEEGSRLIFAGIVSFSDPLKSTSYEAVQLLTRLGIQLKIITGDSAEVAGAVGVQLGILSHPTDVITGSAFEALSPQEKRLAAEKYRVFARTLPTHKYEILEHLKTGHSVGFLGEGFNDVPALKVANLAITVSNASDMARNVSDIVLTQEDLLVLAQGVEEGRKIFANVVKYIRTTLAANVGNFFSITFASFLLPFLPILPIQLLLVNLLSDFPMISISLDNVSHMDLQQPERYNLNRLYFFVVLFGIINTLFDFVYFSTFYRFGEHTLQTGWFAFNILAEIAVFFSLRTLLPVWKGGAPSRTILVLSLLAITGGFALTWIPLTQIALRFVPLLPMHLFLLGAIAAGYLVTNEIAKNFYTKFRSV